jgi:hypothetical protein
LAEEPWRALYYYVLQGERQECGGDRLCGKVGVLGDEIKVSRFGRGGGEDAHFGVAEAPSQTLRALTFRPDFVALPRRGDGGPFVRPEA